MNPLVVSLFHNLKYIFSLNHISISFRCVKGCETDENCPYGEECVAREDDSCTWNCPPGNIKTQYEYPYQVYIHYDKLRKYKYYITIISSIFSGVCVPYRCKDHSTSWGGHLIGKNFSSVGQKATFKCKEGYFIPGNKDVTDGHDIQKNRSTGVICQNVSNKLVPVSISKLELYSQIFLYDV